MKSRFLLVGSLLLFAFLAAACGAQVITPADIQDPVSTLAASTAVQTEVVDNLNTLVAALKNAGLTVETGDMVEQPFFTVPGQILNINGAEVQAFEFETPEALNAAAAEVAADGGSIGTNMVTWEDAPHFFRAGRTLVLYVGQDPVVLKVLEGILGSQFAGR